MVLVVETEPLARVSLGELFCAENYTVLSAANVEEAMPHVAANPHIDAVLIDLYTPSWDRFMDHVRRATPGALIVAMGSFDTGMEKLTAERLGAHLHVEKPLLFSELHTQLSDLLRRRG